MTSPQQQITAKLFKTQDVLDFAGISRGTLYNYIAQGLPYIKVGRSLRFDPESVQQWFKNLEVSA